MQSLFPFFFSCGCGQGEAVPQEKVSLFDAIACWVLANDFGGVFAALCERQAGLHIALCYLHDFPLRWRNDGRGARLLQLDLRLPRALRRC